VSQLVQILQTAKTWGIFCKDRTLWAIFW
jgi:hypothetical protein